MHHHPAVIMCLLGVLAGTSPASGGEPTTTDVFARSNLVAWCIVPFDAAHRGPAERARMLKDLGLLRCAYDWREQHVPSFEDEIRQYQRAGIELFAFWEGHDEAFRLFKKYDLRPQIWRTAPSPDAGSQAARVEAAADALQPLAAQTAQLKCRLGLYNHGGWGGEPANLVAVCRRLRDRGHEHVGIVYNFHHGHGHIDDWRESLQRMQPYLLCLNINGMNRSAEPKILAIGQGQHELTMLQVVAESGYQGPVGILDHRPEVDARQSLQENLEGLDRIRQLLAPPGNLE